MIHIWPIFGTPMENAFDLSLGIKNSAWTMAYDDQSTKNNALENSTLWMHKNIPVITMIPYFLRCKIYSKCGIATS